MFLKRFSWQAALLCGALSLVACGEPDAVCNNSIVEAPEECDDGNNINGDGCTAVCKIEPPVENCGNTIDDDGDTLVDCLDIADCGNNGFCTVNSCGFNEVSLLEVDPNATIPLTLVDNGISLTQSLSTSDGIASTIDGSCQVAVQGGGGGLDIVFKLTVPAGGGLLSASLLSPGLDNPDVDQGIIIHTVCGGDPTLMPPTANELACGDLNFAAGETEAASAAVQAGTVFLTVGAFAPGSDGAFDLTIDFVGFAANEIVGSTCLDEADNDDDGDTDCADADCALEPDCVEALNCQDFFDNDVDGDTDCADAACQNLGPTLCEDGLTACTVATQAVDCRTGVFLCENGTTACTVATAAVDCLGIGAAICNDAAIGAGACSVSICGQGAGAVGTACELPSDCAANAATDSNCLIPGPAGFGTGVAGGYCTEACDPAAANDCGANGVCLDVGFYTDLIGNATGEGTCLDRCTTNADCRTGEGLCEDATTACTVATQDVDCLGIDLNANGVTACNSYNCIDPDAGFAACAGGVDCFCF